MAQKPFKATAEQRHLVQQMMGCGCTEAEVVQCIPWGQPKPISEATLRRHFGDEIERGKALSLMRLKKTAFELATAGDRTMLIFLLKTRAGWSETVKTEISGAGGAPLAAPLATLYLPSKDTQAPLNVEAFEARRVECRLPPKAELVPALTRSSREPPPPTWHEPAEPAPRVAGAMKPGTDSSPSAAELFRR